VTYSRYNFESVGVLIALAPDPAVVARAEIVMNLMLLDNAIHSFHGQPASSKGTAQCCIHVSHITTAKVHKLSRHTPRKQSGKTILSDT
jgi:hypothetical protein